MLEARDRVGGKMHTVEIDGCQVDLGAHWVGPTQRRVLALADEFGIEVEKQYLDGKHLLTLGGERHEPSAGCIPLLSPLGTLETGVGVARVELRRRLVQREDAVALRGAARLDSYTLAPLDARPALGRARARCAPSPPGPSSAPSPPSSPSSTSSGTRSAPAA